MIQPAPSLDWFSEWRDATVAAAEFHSTPQPLASSSDWMLTDGSIRHRTGRFFSVIGVEESSGASYPLIDQPDIGLLGFLVAGPPDGVAWLSQMKVEPGTVGVAQIAPTVQATRSNLDRVHAGPGPPLADEFRAARGRIASDGLWSEQGSRFLGKRNRNVTIRVAGRGDAIPATHRWLTSARIREALSTDFAVNTDARSVIATAPWRFVGHHLPFGGDLRRSYLHRDPQAAEEVRAAIALSNSTGLRRIPLDQLPDAAFDDSPTPLRHPRLDVVHRSIRAKTREVPAWDQPLISTSGNGRIYLLLRRGTDGILRAVLSIDESAGLTAGPELTATLVDSPGTEIGPAPTAEVLVSSLVSDEGGRFDREVSTVTIAVGETHPGPGTVELTLGDLETVMRSPMTTTNELRTAVALLLSLA